MSPFNKIALGRKCNSCESVLTKENAYKYNGYLHSKCKDCRNAYGRKMARKKAKDKNRWKMF